MSTAPPPYDGTQAGYPPPQPGYAPPPQAGYAPPPQAGYAPPPAGYAPPPAGYAPSPPGHYQAPPPQAQPMQQTSNNVVVVNSQQGANNTVIVHKRGVNHCLHCIITVLFFPWIIVWIILCITD